PAEARPFGPHRVGAPRPPRGRPAGLRRGARRGPPAPLRARGGRPRGGGRGPPARGGPPPRPRRAVRPVGRRPLGRGAARAAAAEIRRDGGQDRLPSLVVTVPRGRAADAASRALLREALAEAAWSGEPVLALDDPGLPSRGTRSLRVGPGEAADPFRFEGGD